MNVASTVDYGRKSRRTMRGSTKLIIGAVTIAILVLLLGSLELIGPALTQLGLLYNQHLAMTYSAPADQIMYEEDPQACSSLLRTGHYEGYYEKGGSSALTDPPFQPVDYVSGLRDHDRSDATGLNLQQPIVFMHGRLSPGGHRRCVQVETHDGFDARSWNGSRLNNIILPAGKRMVPLCYGVFTPLSMQFGSKATMASFNGPFIELNIEDRWRVYAGQADPADATHFTIGYAINGKRGTIEGWLQDNDRLRFRVVDGPATTRPTQYFAH